MQKALSITGIVILSLLTVISVVVIGYSIYYFRYTHKLVINNINANALTYVDKEQVGTRFPIEVNMFSNKNKNGVYCFETLFNTYTNGNLPEAEKFKNIYSTGVQVVNEIKTSTKTINTGFLNLQNSIVSDCIDNAVYYNTDIYADKSYTAIQNLNEFNGFIFDSNGVLFTLAPGKNVQTSSVLWFDIYHRFDINTFIIDLEKAVYSLEDGEFILQFNISKYFNWALIDTDNNTSTGTDNINKTIDFTIFNIKINKSSNGLVRANQSIFKKVNNDKDFSVNVDSVNDFGNVQFNYYINEFNFSVIENEKGKYLKLKEDITEFINSFKSVNLVIDINLNSKYFDNAEITGLSDDAFNGLPFKSCKISTNEERTFDLGNNTGNFVFENITIQGVD